jgi:hypothetical protein
MPCSRQEERIYTSHSFLTSTLDGVRGQRHALAALYSGNGPLVPFWLEAESASELVWTQRIKEKSFASAGIEPRSSSL